MPFNTNKTMRKIYKHSKPGSCFGVHGEGGAWSFVPPLPDPQMHPKHVPQFSNSSTPTM
jgi:hypothetical protein